jgi:hypothetical protein
MQSIEGSFMNKSIFTIAIGLAELLFLGPAVAHDLNENQITSVMKKMFEKPNAPLTVTPISVEGEFAVASWIQGGRGGRAFLQKDKDQWFIAVCGGSGLTQADVLQSIGMNPDAAARLAAKVVASEGKLGADRHKLLDGFEGMVKVEQAAGQDEHSMRGKHAVHTAPLQK